MCICALWHYFGKDAEDSALVGGGLVTGPADDQEPACSWLGRWDPQATCTDSVKGAGGGGEWRLCVHSGLTVDGTGLFSCGLEVTKCSMGGVCSSP